MNDVSEEKRCKRTGSKWRCPQKALPGIIYCEKHHQYNLTRTNSRKNKVLSSAGKCGLSSSTTTTTAAAATAVEPYRPVIDFTAVEEASSLSGGGNVGSSVNEGEVMGWLLGEIGGNDYFTLPELGVGDDIFGSFGAIHDHGDLQIEPCGGGGNGNFALGEPCGAGPTQFSLSRNGNSAIDGFSKAIDTEVWENNQEFDVGRNDIKCGESNGSRHEFSMMEMKETSVGNNNVSLAKGFEGQFEELGCSENVVVMGMEARSSLVRGEEMMGEGQRRKKHRSIGVQNN